jgi:hypothetical protein
MTRTSRLNNEFEAALIIGRDAIAIKEECG